MLKRIIYGCAIHAPGLLSVKLRYNKGSFKIRSSKNYFSSGDCEGPNAMELNTKADQLACSDITGSLNTLNDGGRHYNDDIQKISPNSEVGSIVREKVATSISPDIEAHSVCALNGDYRGIGTLLSIDSLDLFEIIREEILAAEAGEFEVIENGLLNAGEEGHEEPPREENRVQGSFVSEFEVTGIDRGDSQDNAEKCASQDEAVQVRDSALLCVSLRKEEDGQAGSIESPNGELLEDALLLEMGAEDYEAASSEDKEVENKTVDARDSDVFSQKEDVFLQKEDGQGELLGSANDGLLDDAFLQEVERIGAGAAPSEDNKVGFENHQGFMSTPSEDNKGDFENHVFQHEGIMAADVREAGLVHGHQDADGIGHKEYSNTFNVEVNGNTFSREDEGTGTDEGIVTLLDKDIGDNEDNVTLLDNKGGDNGDHVLQDEMLDKLSEHSEDDYTAGAFSGPMAFSGMLSYSGMISYSGQIPYSGNLSLHSDSSTSTRSFAFPILASDWNSSPAKIGHPDSRYFTRQRRRWRPRFCCRRPRTLFD